MGAVVKGCSLANDDLDDPRAWRKVYQALLDHAVLVFPAQFNLTVPMQQRFAERFSNTFYVPALPVCPVGAPWGAGRKRR